MAYNFGMVSPNVTYWKNRMWPCGVVLLTALFWLNVCAAMEQVTLSRDGKNVHLSGKVLVEAQDGGVLLMDREGVLWTAQPDEIVKRIADDQPFAPLGSDVLKASLLQQLGGDFRFHQTAHYLIAYNTSQAYAEWCGSLYERLYRAFHNYWEKRGVTLVESEVPLIALVFDGKVSYGKYARTELGETTSSVIGYYSLRTNRVAMYDLTRTDSLRERNPRISSAAHVNRILSQPGGERTVATIIHEATHQLAYNCGMHDRSASIPLWLSEGMAIYFETPDLKSSSGWRRIGSINRVRLAGFRQYLRTRPADSLLTLLASDLRLRQTRTAADGYAEAWALSYYLINRHQKAYAKYIQTLAAKKPLQVDTPEERVAEFQAAFGEDLQKLDQDFLRYMQRLR
ncbi:MAG: hypothetical protein CL681_18845 [Blastopirellula sp.]|nr:hypothetical protein [Blastopirellula sp.]